MGGPQTALPMQPGRSSVLAFAPARRSPGVVGRITTGASLLSALRLCSPSRLGQFLSGPLLAYPRARTAPLAGHRVRRSSERRSPCPNLPTDFRRYPVRGERPATRTRTPPAPLRQRSSPVPPSPHRGLKTQCGATGRSSHRPNEGCPILAPKGRVSRPAAGLGAAGRP